MVSQDIIIVGGGPIGGYIADRLATHNISVCLFEKHPSAGRPLRCAGLVSSRIFEYFSIDTQQVVQNTVSGAFIHPPSGNPLEIGGDGKTRAYVIDRVGLDELILKQATLHGAKVYYDHQLLSAQLEENKMVCTFGVGDTMKQISTSLLIGADGPHSKVRSSCLLPEPYEYLQGIGAEVSNSCLDPAYVHVFVGETIAPGFFAWVIPTNSEGTTARIGLCRTAHAKTSLKKCFSNLLNQPLLDGIFIERYIGGTIPLGAIKQSTRDHVLVVGDAAAQVKPTSGGGLYPGLCCAKQCVDVVVDAHSSCDFSNEKLVRYHQAWKAEIGTELARGMRFRSVFTRLSDEKVATILQKLSTQKIRECIERHGDIDYPSKLVLPLLSKAPSLIKLIPHLFT